MGKGVEEEERNKEVVEVAGGVGGGGGESWRAWETGCWRRLSTFLERALIGVTPTMVAQSAAALSLLTPSYSRKRAKVTAGLLILVSVGAQSVHEKGGDFSLESMMPSSTANPLR